MIFSNACYDFDRVHRILQMNKDRSKITGYTFDERMIRLAELFRKNVSTCFMYSEAQSLIEDLKTEDNICNDGMDIEFDHDVTCICDQLFELILSQDYMDGQVFWHVIFAGGPFQRTLFYFTVQASRLRLMLTSRMMSVGHVQSEACI